MDAFNESLANGIIIFLILFIRYLLFEVASIKDCCGINFTTDIYLIEKKYGNNIRGLHKQTT